MTNATNNVARVAAAVAGFGLVAMSFAPLAGAATMTTTTTTTTTAPATFTRNLTIGSTGADVTALQTWLIAKGYSIPAGATGYFGMQTKAALSAYQAAKMITPAVGYFGPITRAAVMADGGSTTTGGTTTGGTTTTGGLSGGEADLRSFDLRSGDVLSEGDTDKEIAVAEFDVRNGDARIQRVTIEVTGQSSSSGVSKLPWKFFDTLSVFNGSKSVGSVDASSKNDWSKSGNTYSIDVPVDTIVRQDTTNFDLSIRADAASSIDTSDAGQTFKLVIPDNGIRAVDSKGIQQYTGDDAQNTIVDFDTADSGNLVVSASSDNPNASVLLADDKNSSDDFDVLKFQIRNKDNTDVDFNTMIFNVVAASTTANNIIRRATLDLDGDTYTGTISSTTITFDDLSTSVSSDSTINGTLTVSLYGQTGHYATSGEALTFSLVGSTVGKVDAESADNGDTATVSGTAQGKKQSIGVNSGVMVAGGSNSTNETYNSQTSPNSTGTFTLKLDVTANGDNIYIPRTVSTATTSTTAGFVIDTQVAASTTSATSLASSVTSTADIDSGNTGYYIVRDGDTETFTVSVTIDPSAAGYYQMGFDAVHYNTTTSLSGLTTLDIDQTDSEFQTAQLYIHN